MSLCINCAEPTKKYKCPKCFEPYCSLDCYKLHKESPKCAAKPMEEVTENLNTELDLEPTLHEPFSTEDTVPKEKLEELRHAGGLHKLLYNPHLRRLLQEIDVAHNAHKAMCAAMQEPLFIEFADECLKILEPMTEEDQREQELIQS